MAAVYTTAPFVRSPEEFLSSLMPRQPGNKTRAKARTQSVRPRPVAKRAWASLEREPAEVFDRSQMRAAEAQGINRATLHRKLRKQDGA